MKETSLRLKLNSLETAMFGEAAIQQDIGHLFNRVRKNALTMEDDEKLSSKWRCSSHSSVFETE